MNIEEKAKRYDEAIEKGKQIQNTPYTAHWDIMKEVAEHLLPELKESEDEIIRKEIISAIKEDWPGHEDWISWLEKQGEQKLVDKVEPKFKVGDWVISPNGVYWHIDKISNNRYEVTSNTGESSNWNLDTNIYHRFTTQDAKEGDVLADKYNNIGIFLRCEGICWHSYIYLGCDGELRGFSIGGSHIQSNTKPATKEQRDQLEKAMADAGYTFDFEKKELNKIEEKSVEWNEEDKVMLESIIADFCGRRLPTESQESWLRALKDRVQPQPKQEWSEEDEKLLNDAISLADECDDIELRDWLKSLRPQSTWKPDGDQLDALYDMIRSFKKESSYTNRDDIANIVDTLLEQLKAL